MPEPTLDALETVFAQVVAGMDKDEFDSHEFILKLACDHQHLYVNALTIYADTSATTRPAGRWTGITRTTCAG